MTPLNSYQTNDARVLGMLRRQELTRYQIQERLANYATKVNEATVNRLLESLFSRQLVDRDGVKYGLSRRGAQALLLIDQARNVHAAERDAVAGRTDERDDGVRWFADQQQQLLMKRGRIRATSEADLRPAPARTGSLRFLDFPSRYGNTLRYRDGRITDMAGNPV